VLSDQSLEFAHDAAGPAVFDLRVDALIEQRQAQLPEAGDLALGKRLEANSSSGGRSIEGRWK
jgi:hypothetical protein